MKNIIFVALSLIATGAIAQNNCDSIWKVMQQEWGEQRDIYLEHIHVVDYTFEKDKEGKIWNYTWRDSDIAINGISKIEESDFDQLVLRTLADSLIRNIKISNQNYLQDNILSDSLYQRHLQYLDRTDSSYLIEVERLYQLYMQPIKEFSHRCYNKTMEHIIETDSLTFSLYKGWYPRELNADEKSGMYLVNMVKNRLKSGVIFTPIKKGPDFSSLRKHLLPYDENNIDHVELKKIEIPLRAKSEFESSHPGGYTDIVQKYWDFITLDNKSYFSHYLKLGSEDRSSCGLFSSAGLRLTLESTLGGTINQDSAYIVIKKILTDEDLYAEGVKKCTQLTYMLENSLVWAINNIKSSNVVDIDEIDFLINKLESSSAQRVYFYKAWTESLKENSDLNSSYAYYLHYYFISDLLSSKKEQQWTGVYSKWKSDLAYQYVNNNKNKINNKVVQSLLKETEFIYIKEEMKYLKKNGWLD